MTHHPEPAPYGASAAYGGGAPPRRRRRPSAWWFALAGVLLVGGLALAVPAIVLSVAAFTQVDARIPADGVTRTVQVEPGTTYLFWKRPGEAPRCRAVDDGARTDLRLRSLGSTSFSRDLGDGEWVSDRTFVPTSGSVAITCPPGSSGAELGERPRVHTLLGGVFLGLVLPILLALAGVAALLVVGILYATGAPRASVAR